MGQFARLKDAGTCDEEQVSAAVGLAVDLDGARAHR